MRTMNNPYNAEAIADDNIIFFIKEFRLSQGKEGEETIKSLFRSGYSYAFASMLNKFFTGGTICWVAPFSHVVYMHSGVPYDIEGIYNCEGFEYFIPLDACGRLYWDFMNRIDVQSGMSDDDKLQIILDYCSATGLDYNPIVEEYL